MISYIPECALSFCFYIAGHIKVYLYGSFHTGGQKSMQNYLFLSNDYFDITIYQYGREQCEPFHTFGPAIRNHYLIHCILSGKGIYRTVTQDHACLYELCQDQAFLIEPNQIVHYSADEKEPWEYMWIEFDGLKAKEFLNHAGLSQAHPVFTATSPEGCRQVFSPLLHMLDCPDMLPAQIVGYTYLFFGALMKHSKAARPLPKNDIKQFYVQSTAGYIENHYMEDISIEDIAAHLGLNRSYFSKLFKKMTHKSPQEFLITYRIHKACEYLRSTNMTIGDIASHVGYPNQFHFTRAFKSIMKLPPNEWRKQNHS